MNVKGDEADKSWQLTQFPCVSDYAAKQCLNNSFLGRQALADINCRRDFTTPLKICTWHSDTQYGYTFTTCMGIMFYTKKQAIDIYGQNVIREVKR